LRPRLVIQKFDRSDRQTPSDWSLRLRCGFDCVHSRQPEADTITTDKSACAKFPIIVRNAARASDHLGYSRGRAVDGSSELPGGPGPPPREPMVQRALSRSPQRRQTKRREAVGCAFSTGRPPALAHYQMTRVAPTRRPDTRKAALFPELLAPDEVRGDRDIERRAEHSVRQGYGCELPGSEGREAAVPTQFM
jgi:hypothetical protein